MTGSKVIRKDFHGMKTSSPGGHPGLLLASKGFSLFNNLDKRPELDKLLVSLALGSIAPRDLEVFSLETSVIPSDSSLLNKKRSLGSNLDLPNQKLQVRSLGIFLLKIILLLSPGYSCHHGTVGGVDGNHVP